MVAFACPACFVSGAQKTIWQTFWALSVMGLLPLAISVAVVLYIIRLQKNEQNEITHP